MRRELVQLSDADALLVHSDKVLPMLSHVDVSADDVFVLEVFRPRHVVDRHRSREHLIVHGLLIHLGFPIPTF